MASDYKQSGYIDRALAGGGQGPSEQIVDKSLPRKGQSLKSAYPLDNVELAMEVKDEMGGRFAGGIDNLGHSLSGCSVDNADINAAGPVKHVIIKDH